MPCMKDYGKTWDYERTYGYGTFVLLTIKDGKIDLGQIPKVLPKYRKYANQYGVSGFKKV